MSGNSGPLENLKLKKKLKQEIPIPFQANRIFAIWRLHWENQKIRPDYNLKSQKPTHEKGEIIQAKKKCKVGCVCFLFTYYNLLIIQIFIALQYEWKQNTCAIKMQFRKNKIAYEFT